MRKIVVASDSFKGSLSSREVAVAFAEGWGSVMPDCEVRGVAIADGGEGSVEALVDTLGGEYVTVAVADPLGRPVEARYGVVAGDIAIIEMSSASGLTLLAHDERNPMLTSTYGTGELIADALRRGCRRLRICIGGSATNDGGMGMLRALGFRLLDAAGRELLGRGCDLVRLARIDDSGMLSTLRDAEIVVACDVDNVLYGEQGAAAVYAPQKGADGAMVELLDRGLRNYADVVARYCCRDVSMVSGAGAAGGIGAGFMAVLGARLERGVEMILGAMDFDGIIAGCDLVVTGEGRIDSQTVMGKAPSGVLRAAMRQGIDVVAIGGSVAWCKALRDSGFKRIYAIADPSRPLEELMRCDIARENVRNTAACIARQMSATL